MHRLRCGVIYTNAFAGHLAELYAARDPGAAGNILELEYVKVAGADEKNGIWWRMDWVPEKRVPVECRFEMGRSPVCMRQQTQRGLKNRCLDWRDGAVVIKS